MSEIEKIGGAKIGLARATWPFAKLTVNEYVLQLNASIIGNLYFRSSDIVSIEPSSLLRGIGIKINHRVENYSSNVIFLTTGAKDLIRQIEATGFLQHTGPLPDAVETEIATYQSGGWFPMKWPAVIAFIVIWNALFLADLLGYFGKKSNMAPGNGARMAVGFAFLFALGILILAPLRRLVLKEGRTIKDVRTFLLFLMLITGFMFLVLSVIPG
jgi:hypothetical protein